MKVLIEEADTHSDRQEIKEFDSYDELMNELEEEYDKGWVIKFNPSMKFYKEYTDIDEEFDIKVTKYNDYMG